MEISDIQPNVFISYTVADRERVTEVVDQLQAHGIRAWMDYRRIKPGQNWDFEILRALDGAAIIIVFISNNSVNKRGYVQKEIKRALDRADEKLIDDIYLIPVLLDDDAPVPVELKDIQFIKLSDDSFGEKVIDAIRSQLEKIGLATELAQENSEIQWQALPYHEYRDGLPGYEAELRLFRFSSTVYPYIAQVGDIVKAELLAEVMDFRRSTFEPATRFYNYGQARYSRTNTIDAQSWGPKINGRVLSLDYSVHTYFAGAAHPNTHFRTFNFIIDPLFRIDSAELLFEDADQAFLAIQSFVRDALLKLRWDDDESLDAEHVEGGTAGWKHFEAFTFNDKGIEFLFAPYQVAPYVFGPHTVEVPHAVFGAHLKPSFQSALGLEWVNFSELVKNATEPTDPR